MEEDANLSPQDSTTGEGPRESYAQQNSAPSQPNAEPIEQVFSLFKTYLENRLEQKGKELEAKQKIELQAEKFKFKGNQKQFVFNAEIEELVAKIKEANAVKNHTKITKLTEQAVSLLHKRQKLIKLADSSEAGWDAVQEYESQDIASDEDDDKKIRNARAAANRKRKQKERERTQQGNKRRYAVPQVGNPDHQLFRGICILCITFLFLFLISVLCNFSYWLHVSYQPTWSLLWFGSYKGFRKCFSFGRTQ